MSGTNGEAHNDHTGKIMTQDEFCKSTGKPSWDYWNYLRGFAIEGWAEFRGTWYDYVAYLRGKGIGDEHNEPASQAVIIVSSSASKPDKPKDEFTCDADVEGCPILAKNTKARIEMPNVMWRHWNYLTKCFSTEWIAYLKGRKREDGVYEIENMYFPKQKANAAHVEAEDGEIQEGTIGAVHSHVDMGAFFSGEDHKHMNHEIELVINRRAEVAVAVRHQLECGRFTRISGSVYLMGDAVEEALVKELEGRIIEDNTYNQTTTQSSSSKTGFQQRGGERPPYFAHD
jgi:JAB domain-containing protein similar to deubiquitination enzymes